MMILEDNDWPSIPTLVDMVKSRKVSASDVIKTALNKINETKEYQAVISVLADRAIEKAEQIDNLIADKQKVGPLAGVPFVVKDNFLVAGTITSASSNMLKNFEAPYSASAVLKLEQAGAICIAKTNLDAFAHGGSTENSDFFVSLNPHDKTRVPGGSSGGSAAAVSLGIVPFALGSDTGGSIRQPAGFCGVVGFKPSYGRVSRHGVVAMGSSLDCIGPLAKSVSDVIHIMNVINGKDPLDSTTLDSESEDYIDKLAKSDKLAVQPKLKIGLISEYMTSEVNEQVKTAVNNFIEKIKSPLVEIEAVSLPSVSLSLACYYIICPAEVSSNLARYDGLRYGYHQKSKQGLIGTYKLSRGHGFGHEAKRRIIIGSYVLSSGYYDAYYKKAQTVRTKIINEFDQAFSKYDLLIGPVSPTTAFKIAEKSHDPMSMYLSDIMTTAPSLAGIPSISLPIDVDKSNLPIGLQVMAKFKNDLDLLINANNLLNLAQGAVSII